MGITAERLFRMKLIDEVIPEPLGGAHRDPSAMAAALKASLIIAIAQLGKLSTDALLAQRRRRLAEYGVFKET
jgi:acetyl-CoA carboxylase carboxyl transferase subunit alpha